MSVCLMLNTAATTPLQAQAWKGQRGHLPGAAAWVLQRKTHPTEPSDLLLRRKTQKLACSLGIFVPLLSHSSTSFCLSAVAKDAFPASKINWKIAAAPTKAAQNQSFGVTDQLIFLWLFFFNYSFNLRSNFQKEDQKKISTHTHLLLSL